MDAIAERNKQTYALLQRHKQRQLNESIARIQARAPLTRQIQRCLGDEWRKEQDIANGYPDHVREHNYLGTPGQFAHIWIQRKMDEFNMTSKPKKKHRDGPPQHMVEHFDNAKNYIHRFMMESFTINMHMCGMSDDVFHDESIWLHRSKDIKKHVTGLKRDMRKYSTIVEKPLTLYRGTTEVSPTMKPFDVDMKTCSFLSCTTSKKVASTFTMRKGFVHVLKCHPGVIVTKFEDHYVSAQGVAVEHEKEVGLHPNMCLYLNRRKNHVIYWDVKPKSRKRKR